MTEASINDIRLFAINCAVIKSGLDDTINKFSIRPTRSELEEITDRLTEPYLVQIDDEIKRNAAKMSAYYEIFIL